MIDLIPDEQQEELVTSAAAFLLKEYPRSRLRRLLAAGGGIDRAFLQQCGELGWLGLTLPEEDGGAGLSPVDEVLLFRELGRALVPGPFLATALGARVAAAGDAALAGRLASGEWLAGLAEVQPDGEQTVVWDGGDVDLLLVADLDTPALRLVERAPLDLPAGEPSIDGAYRPCQVPSAALGRSALASLEGASAAPLVAQGVLLTAALLVGLAEQTRDESATFTSNRVQFGKPIGAFQAVKHRCADMALRAEAAWAQTAVAALRLALVGAEAAFDVSAAKVGAADAAVRNGRDDIQNHGGVGYTAEYDPHLFLKRAHILEQTFGTPRWHLRVLLDRQQGW